MAATASDCISGKQKALEMSAVRPKTKVVVRNLPPGMTEETWKTVLDNLAGGRYTWVSYFPGKVSLKRVIFSRAYVNFLTAEDVYEFKQRFDGHVFIGQKGHQYKCSVEYAPLQKAPVQEEKPHPLEGTIERDADYLAFLEAYESGQLPPSAGPAPGASAAEMPMATAAAGGEGGEGKVVVSRLMDYLVRKYAEGGNRLGGARSATKAKQSKQDLIQHVQASSHEGRSAVTGKAAKAAAAAAAAAAMAALTAAAAVDASSGAKGPRREKDRPPKGGVSSETAAGTKPADKQTVGSRSTSAKGARTAGPDQSVVSGAPVVNLLTRPSGSQATLPKGGPATGEKPAASTAGGSSGSGTSRGDARPQQQAGPRTTGSAVDGGGAGSVPGHAQEGGKMRGGGSAAGRTATTQGGNVGRGATSAGQEEAPLVTRSAPASTPRLLMVKGGEPRPTQAAPSSGGQPGPAPGAPAGAVSTAAAAKKAAQEAQAPRQPTQQQQQQQQPTSHARSSKQSQHTGSSQQRHEEAGGSSGGAAVTAAAAQLNKAKSSHGERNSNGKSAPAANAAAAASTAAAAASAAATKVAASASSAAAAVPAASAVSGAPALPERVGADDGLAATASAAAAAALAAAAARPSGKKVRAGFQMYVPGSLRGRGPGSMAASGSGNAGAADGDSTNG